MWASHRFIGSALVAFIGLLLGVRYADAAPAHVQGGNQSSLSSSATMPVTLPATVANTDAVVGYVTWDSSSGATLSTIKDNKNNSYVIVDTVNDTGDGQSVASFYLVNITNWPQTITATFSKSVGWRALLVDEYSGIATSAALDGHRSNLQMGVGTTANAVASGSLTTAQAGDLIYAVTLDVNPGTSNPVPGTGLQLRQSTGILTELPMMSEDAIQGAAGTVAGTFTSGQVGATFATAALALVSATAPPPPPPPPPSTPAIFTYNLLTGVCTTSSGSCNNLSTHAVCNGSTASNDAALQSFNDEAQKHTRPAQAGYAYGGTQHNNAQGDGNAYAGANINNEIVLDIAACIKLQYTWRYWPTLIRNLKVVGAGGANSATVMQNVNTAGTTDSLAILSNYDFFGDGFYGINVHTPYIFDAYGHLIQTTSAGATSVTLLNPSFSSEYYVGRWVLIMSVVQDSTGSYPPNMRYYDFAKVTAINGSTGVITLDTPLVYTHLSNRPYDTKTLSDAANSSAIGAGQVGPARIVNIDIPIKPIAENFEIDGINFLHNPTLSPGSNYPADCSSSDGPEFKGIINATANDLNVQCAPVTSMMARFNFNNSSFYYEEADKIIGIATYQKVTATISRYHSGNLLWHAIGGAYGGGSGGQLSCAALNCTLDSGVVLSAAQNNSPNMQLDVPNYTNAVTFNNASFLGSNSLGNTMVNSEDNTVFQVTIGSSGVSLGNGPNGNNTRLIVSKCVVDPKNCTDMETGSAALYVADFWGDGATIVKNHNMVHGATITSITGDATNIYVDVAGSPGFANGQTISATRVQTVSVTNSTSSNIGNGCAPGSGPNNCLRYPSDVNIPNVTWSGNGGN
jgi:hypothetical protein